jgi:hypothetical protein
MSKEHVWPRWVRKLVPPEILAGDHKYVFEDHDGEIRRLQNQPMFNLTVKDVCEPCNNEWMGRAEDAAERYAAGLLLGRGRLLHREGQAALAYWGMLKGFVAVRSFPQKPEIPIGEDQYRELFDLRDQAVLPPMISVYTGKTGWSSGHSRYEGFFRLNGISRSDRENGDQADGYVIAFTVLDLVILVMRVIDDDRAEFFQLGHRPSLTASIRRIWPTTDSCVWPPGPVLTQAGVSALAGGVRGCAACGADFGPAAYTSMTSI